jgi:glycosyltransferase involved in cell wall biosynthesis
MLLSILTPTIEERQSQFQILKNKIETQIQSSSFADQVEHLWFLDDREYSIGLKRNHLLDQATGKFVVFVDDDDDVSDNYVELICNAIMKNPDIDCIGFKGKISFAGSQQHLFVHSAQYRSYAKKRGIYYRPILHINPIKREIACLYKFEDINYSEDIDWAKRMWDDGILKKEYFINEALYFYNSGRKWWYQVLIDRTERIRQILGLQVVNNIRLRRWLKNFFNSWLQI